MADYNQLSLDWAHISPDPDNWSLRDLQLAAELGKTLLERNKELETALRHQQNLSDDQAQEIEYLRKQTAALREVNDSRMRIYEQLEVSIQDLEHANHRLSTQTHADKKHIASLENQVDKLESQLEERQRQLEEERRRQTEYSNQERSGTNEQSRRKGSDTTELTHLRDELSTLRIGQTKQQSLVRQFQATIDALQQENSRLEEQVLSLQHRHEELAVMEQIGRGVVCSRCLRSQEEISLTGDEDNMSIVESIMSSDHCHAFLRENLDDMCESENPYRVLIEKYENLLLLQREAAAASQRCRGAPLPPTQPSMSLQDELKMSGEVWGTPGHIHDDLSEEVEGTVGPSAGLSEGETSSGFSDETINKGTQTEEGALPSFLFRIMDGSDCKFSIYDEANRIESRFRKTPEYRKLFREIFDVLKRAAEAKEEGEDLPLLEDATPLLDQPPAPPPATPSQAPSSSVPAVNQSSGTPIVQIPPTTQPAPTPNTETSSSPVDNVKQDLAYASQSSVLAESDSTKPIPSSDMHKVEVREKKDYMESLYSGVGGGRNKRKGRRQRTPGGGCSSTASGSRGGGSQRGRRWGGGGGGQDSGRSTPSSCGGDRFIERPEPRGARSRPQPPPTWTSEFTPVSSASQDVAKLKQLEKSYAEVLRLGRQRANRH